MHVVGGDVTVVRFVHYVPSVYLLAGDLRTQVYVKMFALLIQLMSMQAAGQRMPAPAFYGSTPAICACLANCGQWGTEYVQIASTNFPSC